MESVDAEQVSVLKPHAGMYGRRFIARDESDMRLYELHLGIERDAIGIAARMQDGVRVVHEFGLELIEPPVVALQEQHQVRFFGLD